MPDCRQLLTLQTAHVHMYFDDSDKGRVISRERSTPGSAATQDPPQDHAGLAASWASVVYTSGSEVRSVAPCYLASIYFDTWFTK